MFAYDVNYFEYYSKVDCYRYQGFKDQRSHSMLCTPASMVGIDRFHCYDLGDFGSCFELQVYYYQDIAIRVGETPFKESRRQGITRQAIELLFTPSPPNQCGH